jgi:type II secretory pathway component PulF
LADCLGRLAHELDRGVSLGQVLASEKNPLAQHVAGVVQAAAQSHSLPEVLVEWADHQMRYDQLRRTIRANLAYPAVLVMLTLLLLAGAQLFLLQPMLRMFEEFQLELPYATRLLVWCHRQGVWWALGLVVLGALGLGLLRLVGGAARYRRIWNSLPLFGSLWHWCGVAEFARLMAVILRRPVALPEALRWTADGVRDANLAELSRQLAAGVERGGSLAELADRDVRVPASLLPLLRWGERSGELRDAFGTAADMYEARALRRAEFLGTLLPPAVFVLVATVILFVLVALYGPVVAMIQGLS